MNRASLDEQHKDDVAAGSARPLANRRIVITRAPEQAAELAERLRQAGAEVLFLPAVRFLDPQDTADLDRAIGSLGEFGWILLTSANAARFFLKRCRALGRAALAPGLKIAAVGSATRAAAEQAGLHVNLVPEEANGSGLAAALLAGMKEAPSKDRTVLLPRSDLASAELPDALRAAGVAVTEVVAYCTAEPESFDSGIRAALLAGNADAVTFFSPSAFRYFARALGERELRRIAERVAFAAVGPVTASAIREAGFTVAVEPAEPSSAALVAALRRHFAARPTARSMGNATKGAL